LSPVRHRHFEHRAKRHLRGRGARQEIRAQNFCVPHTAGMSFEFLPQHSALWPLSVLLWPTFKHMRPIFLILRNAHILLRRTPMRLVLVVT
jgi:hypothetical protein